MNERPTPEEIADNVDYDERPRRVRRYLLKELAEHGYVIVHPDDVGSIVPAVIGYSDEIDGICEGWRRCRAHIFGEDA